MIAGSPIKAGIWAVADSELTNVVVSVSSLSFTTEVGLRFNPVTVKVNGAGPGVTLEGTTNWIRDGSGAANVRIAASALINPAPDEKSKPGAPISVEVLCNNVFISAGGTEV